MSEWSHDDEAEIWREIKAESDRGCVLLCAALLDRGLEKLLRMNFERSSDADKDEIDAVLSKYPDAALTNLTARARYARVQGLISKETSDAIRKFANARNSYAHEDKPPALTKKIGEGILSKMPLKYREEEVYKNLLAAKPRDLSDGKWWIVFVATCLHVELKLARERLAEK